MDKLVEKAFKSLTIRCNIIALHSSDEDSIKITLKTLHKNGIIIDTNLLESWLIANKWQIKPIKNIIAWAETIVNGGRVQIKHKQMAPTEKEVWERLNT